MEVYNLSLWYQQIDDTKWVSLRIAVNICTKEVDRIGARESRK